MSRRYGRRIAMIAVLGILGSSAAASSQVVFGERGFQPHRAYFSQLPFEHIDPLTGNLLLTVTDLVLPGNGGFDLRIQRTYNSKIYRNYQTNGDLLEEDSWAGVGWTLHFGRVFHSTLADGADPIIEMPDGSRRRAYRHISPPPGCGSCFVTRDFWLYDKNTAQLSLPDGRVYTFGHTANTGSAEGPARYATQLADAFGNTVTIAYATSPGDAIQSISQALGNGQTRQVTFTTAGAYGSLRTMAFGGRTWTYDHINASDFDKSLMTAVSPPIGPGWTYAYNTTTHPRNELTSMTTPNGGTIAYTSADQSFNLGSTVPIRTRVITRRTTGGRNITAGTWTYAYAQGAGENETVITGPVNVTTYRFLGVGNFTATGNTWSIGLPSRRTVAVQGTILETEDQTWIASVPISATQEIIGNNWDNQIFVPLPKLKDVTRGVTTLRTEHFYNSGSFNDYGRPYQTTETGNRGLVRSTSRQFQYGFTRYIVDKLQSESVAVGSESIAVSWNYNASNGFVTGETRYGITTTFDKDSFGNVSMRRDANAHTTTYGFSWGSVQSMATPEYTTTRTINPDGTVASETRNGFTTQFNYDSLMRPTVTTPPIGHAKTIGYDNATGTFERVDRGSSFVITTVDGFGRAIGTQNAVGVKTERKYDAAGRLVFDSYPYTGATTTSPCSGQTFTTLGPGTCISYDALGRITKRSNPDNSFFTIAYSGVDRTLTDEEGRTSTQEYSHFGDIDGGWLTAVIHTVNFGSRRVTHTYNALGNLKSVTHQSSTAPRSWSYNARNQLQNETHPESGTTSYTYYAAGNLQTRTDAAGRAATFTYDGNDRVRSIAYSSSPSDNVTIGYDAADNRTSMSTGSVSTVFTFDGSNRLRKRTDTVDSRVFESSFDYDDNDNLSTLTYPSGRVVRYTFDSANRINAVTDGNNAPFATTVSYHPSGAMAGFTAGNGTPQSFTFDSRYRPDNITSGPLNIRYAYDLVGNVRSITDNNRTGFNQTFTTDELDRLEMVSGFGAASYSYDAVGNRTQKNNAFGSVTYAYDSSTQRLSSASGYESSVYGYDSNGNMTSDAAGTYTYTPDDMLRSATITGRITSFAYDPDKIRIRRSTDGVTTYFLHGPSEQLLSEFEVSPAKPFGWLRDYVYAGDRLLAGVSCQLSAAPPSATFASAGGSGVVSVTAGSLCAWTAASDSSWLSVMAGGSGAGGGTVSYSVAANSSGGSRSGTLTIAGISVPVSQAGAACTFALTPASGSFGAGGGSGTVSVTTPAGCPWSASSTVAWLTITAGGSGTGPGTVSYAVAATNSSVTRSAALNVGGQAFTVSQAGGSCTYSLAPATATAAAAGDSLSASVSAAYADCAWSAVSNTSWISITGGATGTGSGTVSYAVSANPASAPRSGSLTAAGQPLSVTQNGASSQPVMWVDSPANGSTQGPNFVIGGWAIDTASPSDTGVNRVDVWAYPASGPSPVFMGTAAYGGARPDVAQAYGARFANSGFSLAVTGLPAGACTFVVSAFSTVAGAFNHSFVLSVTIPPPNPIVSIDGPAANGSVWQPFGVSGWAIDTNASTGNGIDLLHVYAYDANWNPIFLGAATPIAGSRPDVGAAYGSSRFGDSGWGLTVSGLAPGTYLLAVFPRSTVSGTFTAAVSQWITIVQ